MAIPAGETPFSKFLRAEPDALAQLVYQDDDVVVFPSIKPQAAVHLLIVPKMPILNLVGLDDNDVGLMGKMLLVASRLAEKYGLDKTGFRIVANSGKDASQTVFHLHFHLLGGEPLGKSCNPLRDQDRQGDD